jgi:uncharacterized protein YgiM (DUF1202 family)
LQVQLRKPAKPAEPPKAVAEAPKLPPSPAPVTPSPIPVAPSPRQEAASLPLLILAPKEAQAAVIPPSVTYLVTTSACNVRSEPNVKSKVITTLKKGQKVEKLDQLENWCNIKLLSGEKGWIHKDLVKETE